MMSRQALYLPVEVWAIVKQHMSLQEWAKACGASPATFALRPVVAAEVRSDSCSHEDLSMRHLQLDRWHYCHSIFLNIQQLHEAAEVTEAQIKQIALASSTALDLHCLHIIGRDHLPLWEKSIADLVMSLLAKHASVLTLQVKAVVLPQLPALQHLVLDLDASSGQDGWNRSALFPAINKLQGLKSLYVQALKGTLYTVKANKVIDLRGCRHLRHMAVQGILFYEMLALPAGCLFHMICVPTYVHDASRAIAPLVTGLMLRHSLPRDPGYRSNWPHERLLRLAPSMYNLKHLRLNLDKEQLPERYRQKEELRLHFDWLMSPSLEVLELSVGCSLAVFIETGLKLDILVVVATGWLIFFDSCPEADLKPWCKLPMNKLRQPPMNRLKQMYLHSGAAFSPIYKAALKGAYVREAWAGVRLLDYVREEQDCWTAQMPINFQPGSLQECCCRACPECLARAGVPVLCDQAWTSHGFDKHLRPH